jgi:two-component system KDP operon response regulator KdpE
MKPSDLVLIVEDDDAIINVLEIACAQYHYRTQVARSMKEASRTLQAYSPDVILLDLGLPDGDGKELLKELRRALLTPVIILSARHEEKEIITSLELGADDYVVKPFSVKELFARVQSAQRRFMAVSPGTPRVSCKDIVMDLDQHTVFKDEILLKLTPTEYNLLRYLLLNRNRVLTHQQILKEVWGLGYQHEMQYLRTFINSLRKKIETDTSEPVFIQTELGIGYRFCCPGSGPDGGVA